MLILAALALVQGPEPFALPELPPRAQTVRGAVEGDPAAVRRDRGVWPIANGRVFAYVGYGEPANRMFMVTGPQYQTRRNHEPDGTFGQLWIELVEGDSPLMAVERTWQEASRAAAVRTREGFASGAGLETTDFAHAERPVLLRRVRVELPDAAGARLVVHFDDRPDGPARADGTALRKTYRKDDATFRLHASVLHATEGTAVTAEDGTLTIVLPEGVPRPELTLALVTSRSPDEEQETLRAVAAADPDALLDDALRAWRRELDGTLTAWPSGPIQQAIESVKKLTLAQRSAEHGPVAPMVSFKGVWARDSNGPIRTFLWAGRPDLARDLLVYYRRASALHRHTHREYPLDLGIEDAPAESPEFWASTGTDRCEVPSWIVLQHARYWHATGDADTVRAAWPYVRRNLEHQEFTEHRGRVLQRFNGDETYLHGAFYALFPGRGVWPNQFPRASAWSLDSLLAWLAASRAAPALATVVGADRDFHARNADRVARLEAAVDAFWIDDLGMWAPAASPIDLTPHRAPYGPINLRPLALGTHAPEDPHARRNLATTAALLVRENGLLRMTPSVADYIGALQGYWLANLTAVDHPLAWPLFERILGTCDPSGAWAEVHAPDSPGHGYGDGTLPNRLRPWESGLVLDALLGFLTGAEPHDGDSVTLAPRRPPTLPLERLGPLRVGDARLVLHYPEDDEHPVRVEHRGGPALTVNGTRLAPGESTTVPLVTPADLPPFTPRPFDGFVARPPGERLIVTTLADPDPAPGDVFLDAGLPFTPSDLARLLFDERGERRYATVVLEPWARRADRETMKPEAFWEEGELRRAFERFEAEGGTIQRPTVAQDWWVCGPFPNPDSQGLFLEDRPVRLPFDPEHTFAVEGQELPARWHRRRTDDGRLDLHLPDGPQDELCVFARTVITSDTDRDATLLLGSDDGCRAWLNGELVFESLELRHLVPDQFRVPIRLRAGENVLVIGVEDRHGGFGLAARVR